MLEPAETIAQAKDAGMLKALPIVRTDKHTGALVAADGTELVEFWANDGTWVPVGALTDGSIRYLGSSTHAGHIELKALYVMCGGVWYNILTGRPDETVAPLAAPMLGMAR
jgi:hypothetical protein